MVKRRKKNNNLRILLIVLAIIVGLGAIFAAIKTFAPNMFGKSSLYGELAAKVNDKPITAQELESAYDRMPAEYKLFITKETLLSQMIDEILLREEAQRQGIQVTDAEIEGSIQDFLTTNQLSESDLDELLKNRSMSREELKTFVSNQLIVEKVINQSVNAKIVVSDDQALTYYNENKQLFETPETVTARHILIANTNRTDAETEREARRVMALINSTNFCDLVKQYTADPGSADICGEYTFPRGQMVPEFEEASFTQPIGNMSLVNTTFGYHIVQTLNRTEGGALEFAGVKDQIKQVVAQQQERTAYQAFIEQLRSNAKIVNYLNASKSQEGNAMTGDVVAVPSTPNTTVTVAEPEPQETQTSVNIVSSRLECALAKSTLYGAYWDSTTQKQLEELEGQPVQYIECGVKGDLRAQEPECDEAEIEAYPTWVIDGNKQVGLVDAQRLIDLAGC